MKCLTVCQPYAHLIIRGDGRGLKRIENRTWPTRFRGRLAIHAGKSRAWLDREAVLPAGMVFGAIIGTVTVAGCFRLAHVRSGFYDAEFPGLSTHVHAEGPYCWVLTDPRPLPAPVPFKGMMGLFDVDDHAINLAAASCSIAGPA